MNGKSKPEKTEFDLLVGRRIQETIDLLRLSENPDVLAYIQSIQFIDWKKINEIIQDLPPDEIFLLGKLSGLLRVGRDIHSLSQTPLILTKAGEVVQNIQKLPVRIVQSYEEGLSYVREMNREEGK